MSLSIRATTARSPLGKPRAVICAICASIEGTKRERTTVTTLAGEGCRASATVAALSAGNALPQIALARAKNCAWVIAGALVAVFDGLELLPQAASKKRQPSSASAIAPRLGARRFLCSAALLIRAYRPVAAAS